MDAGFLPDGQPFAIAMLGGTDKITQCIDDHLNPTTSKALFEENLEVFTIPESDPRVALRGQRGVRTVRALNNLTLLGIYSSHVYHFAWHGATCQEFAEMAKDCKTLAKKRSETSPSDKQTLLAIEKKLSAHKQNAHTRVKNTKCRKMAGPQDCIRYFENELSENKSQGCRYRYDLDYGPHCFIYAPFKQLSPMHLINAPEPGQEINVIYAFLKLKNRFPLIVVLTDCPIKRGDELLVKYREDGDVLPTNMNQSLIDQNDLNGTKSNWSSINQFLQCLELTNEIPIEPTAQENQLTDWKDLWLN
ncbi:MAG: hypothetical protein V6Z78_04390 [Holosporaceae bacterium]